MEYYCSMFLGLITRVNSAFNTTNQSCNLLHPNVIVGSLKPVDSILIPIILPPNHPITTYTIISFKILLLLLLFFKISPILSWLSSYCHGHACVNFYLTSKLFED